MSAFGMHPTFKTRAEYDAWLAMWRVIYRRQVGDCRKARRAAKINQRRGDAELAAKFQRERVMQRVMGQRLMKLLADAQARWARIAEMKAQIAAQAFPLDLGRCPVIDFHFNKGHMDFPDILPMWVVKAKGQIFYVPHVEFEQVSITTRELPSGSTRGMLRVRHAALSIDDAGVAILRRLP